MLDTLITSKTRIKLLLKFFLNSSTQSYLRNLEAEFGESTNGIRLELNKFEQAGMLESAMEGNRKVFKANIAHPLFPEIQGIVRKFVGIDKIIDKIIANVGALQLVCLIGDYAKGKDSGKMEIILIGERLNLDYIQSLGSKMESLIKRKIFFTTLTLPVFKSKGFRKTDCLVLWDESF